MKKTVYLTGRFDPATRDHLDYARKIIKDKMADEVIMCPLEGPRLKERKQLLDILTAPYRHIATGFMKGAKKADRVMNLDEQKGLEAENIMSCWPKLTGRMKRHIMQNGMYQEEIASAMVSEKRYRHMKAVASLAKELAVTNGIDPDQAYTAGIFHDIAKSMDDETTEFLMNLYYPSFKGVPKPLWHQFTGAVYLSRYLKMSDRKVLKAVRHHGTGDGYDPLSMLIYACDKLDPSRGYDSEETIEMCRRNIKDGFKEVHRQQYEYLKKEGII